MANYFGNTLTDLQNAVTAAERLKADQNIAQMGNAVRFMSGTQQALSQRDALQQQNAMRQAELAAQREIAFGNQRTQLDVARTAAEARANLFKLESAENVLDRTSREKIAGLAADSRDRTPQIASQEAELAAAADGFAEALNERDYLQSQMLDLTGLVGDKGIEGRVGASGLPGLNMWNTDQKRGALFFNQLPPSVPVDPANPFSANVDMARTSLATKLANISALIKAGEESGVANLVARGPDNRWVSKFRGSAPAAPVAAPPVNYFRPTMGDLRMAEAAAPPPVFGTPPQTNSVTNAGAVVPNFFNRTNTPPATVTEGRVVVQKNGQKFRLPASQLQQALAEGYTLVP